jgi:hypothetical protein
MGSRNPDQFPEMQAFRRASARPNTYTSHAHQNLTACGVLHIEVSRSALLSRPGAFVLNEVLMRRFPSNLSESELREYRRWTAGFYLSYLTAIIVALGLTYANRPAGNLTASNEIQTARSKATPAAIDVAAKKDPATARHATKP